MIGDGHLVDGLVAWIGAHPILAGGLVFAVAFLDALVIVGFFVPAGPLLFAVGALVALGTMDPVYAVLCAAAGAFCGDGVSYLVGWRYGDRLRRMWPFSRHPIWLDQGETFFRRHGTKSVLIARYVGPVRPVVPAIAAMVGMRARRYVPASAFAAVSWALLYMAPGWLVGASLDVLRAVAGRLGVLVLVLVTGLIAVCWLVIRLYNFFAARAAGMIERLLAWSHRHPVAGRLSAGLIDPRRPESTALALLGLGLFAAVAGLAWLLFDVVGGGEPLALDLAVSRLMLGLRTPFADHLMAGLSLLGDWRGLAPACALAFAWLLWRRRPEAVAHWIAAIAFGVLAMELLGRLLDVPRPPAAIAVAGFSFPSAPVTYAALVFGFFAVLIARELPGRRRAWPYAIAGVLVALLAFARLYFGAHWFSDVLAALLLASVWVALLGLAYRRHVVRAFWMRPLALLFYGTFAVASGWTMWHGAGAAQVAFEPPRLLRSIALDAWWGQAWAGLDATRNDISSARAWPLNLQYAGSPDALRDALAAQGWQAIPPPDWRALLRTLDGEAGPDDLAPLAAMHAGRREALLLVLAADDPAERWMLRLWPADVALAPGETPLWYGVVARMRFSEQLRLLRLWGFAGDGDGGIGLLERQLPQWTSRRLRRDGAVGDVLLLRAPEAATP